MKTNKNMSQINLFFTNDLPQVGYNKRKLTNTFIIPKNIKIGEMFHKLWK
jgi:hypothetical protein